MVKEFHSLPQAGGLLDQDWYLIKLLKAGSYAIAKLEAKRAEDSRSQANRPRPMPRR